MSPMYYILFSSLIIYASAELGDSESITDSDTQSSQGCECSNYDCGCCIRIKEDHLIHIDKTVCANVTYLPEDLGIALTVTLDSDVVISETISVRNPPPICIGESIIKIPGTDICIRLYDLDANDHHLHGCAKFELTVFKIRIAQYDAGCFDIGQSMVLHQTTNKHGIQDSMS